MTIRVRFAPSPTGYLHVGGARTALFNWLLARREGGVFVLRVEDTDRERSTGAATEAILQGMRWLGLEWDEGPYFQAEGVERHRADAERLLREGRAFRDFTTPEEIARIREEDPAAALRHPRRAAEAMGPDESEERAAIGEPHAIRFRVPEGETAWDDEVHGELRFRNPEIDDLVILRTDGTPTYNLAVVSDDAEMRISHVIRGDDHISNTPKQILLHEALGNPVPIYAHVPMILGPDGKRLSKRHGATAVGEYEGEGILPWAMVNFLALLGWSPGGDLEVMDVKEIVERFSLDRIGKKSSVFDSEKLEWLNGRHMERAAGERLEPLVAAWLTGEGLRTPDELAAERGRLLSLIDLLKSRARTVGDLARNVHVYMDDPAEYEAGAVRKHWMKDREETTRRLELLQERLADSPWTEDALEERLRGLASELEVGAGKLIHPLRLAVTGQGVSPGIFEVLVVLGREQSLRRLKRAAELLRSGGPAA